MLSKLKSQILGMRSIWVIPIITGIVILGTIVLSQQAFAYEVYYETIGFEFDHSPTICALEPQDPNLKSNKIKKLLNQARLGVAEWETQLKNAEANTDNKDFWTINYVEIKGDKQKSDSTSECDVIIFFKDKFENPLVEHGVTGFADYDPINDKWEVSIYYLQVHQCYVTKQVGPIQISGHEPCFKGDLKKPQQMLATIQHEIGHTLGLGHFVANDNLVNLEWSQGKRPSPSIMTQVANDVVTEDKIGQVDVAKIREIYKENGFLPDPDANGFNLFKAEKMIKKEFYKEALSYTDKFLKTNPDDKEILYANGLALFVLGKYDETVTTMNKILEINPDNAAALYTKGMALSKAQKYDESLEQLDKVIKINPEHYKAISNIALIYKNQENYEKAIEYYNKFLEINPNDVDALENKAEALVALGKDDEAQTYFDQVKQSKSNGIREADGIISEEQTKPQIPDWIRNNAEWWAQGGISDNDFVSGIQYLIKEGVMQIPKTTSTSTAGESNEIPAWIKNNADWWSQGLISDDDFVKGIQYLVERGIIVV